MFCQTSCSAPSTSSDLQVMKRAWTCSMELELDVLEEQGVLAGQEGLALADGFHACLDPAVVQAVDELVGDDDGVGSPRGSKRTRVSRFWP
jgi:hypothetical protein